MKKEDPKPIWGRILPIYPIKIKNKMKTKEEVIKEAWGELWNTFNESAKKCALSKNGYVGAILQNGLNKDFTDWNAELKAWRPKSLKGIENNNGWIKIESEDDLPEIGTYCHFIIEGFEDLNNQGLFDGMFWDNKCAYASSIVSHYQPIIKTLKPLY